MRGDGHAGSVTAFALAVAAFFFRRLARGRLAGGAVRERDGRRTRAGCRGQRRPGRHSGRAPAERRGETASSFFVVLYLGLSLPVIAAGVAIHYTSIRSAGLAFCAAAGVLSLAVLASQLRSSG